MTKKIEHIIKKQEAVLSAHAKLDFVLKARNDAIIAAVSDGATVTEIARALEMNRTTISLIVNNK